MKQTVQFFLLICLVPIVLLYGCEKEEARKLSFPELKSFSFSQTHNSSLEKNWAGDINDTGDTITFFFPYGIPIDSLIAHFETADGNIVKVMGTVQIAGVSVNDYSQCVTYTVYDEYENKDNPKHFVVSCKAELIFGVDGYSDSKERIGAGDFKKEELFTVENLKQDDWEYELSINGSLYVSDVSAVDSILTIKNPLSEKEWEELYEGKKDSLPVTLAVSLTINLKNDKSRDSTFIFPVQLEKYGLRSWQDFLHVYDDLKADYTMYSDITVPDMDEIFMPIGTEETPFEGTFDGQGYCLKNVSIKRDYLELPYVGVFGYLGYNSESNVIIENLGVEILDSIRGGLYAGGIAGYCKKATIKNCYVIGSVSVDTHIPGKEPSGAGGVVGLNLDGKIENCSAWGGKITGGVDAGGLVGLNYGSNAIIETSWSANTVEVTQKSGNGNERPSCGGLVGENDGGATIKNCYSTGNVAGYEMVGGFVGSHSNAGSVSHCYSSGKVSVKGIQTADDIGGFIGQINGTESRRSVENCYWNSAVNSGEKGVGISADERIGLEGHADHDFKRQEAYAGWDFITVWGIKQSYNNGYAYILETAMQ